MNAPRWSRPLLDRPDVDLRGERAVHRASIGDLQQAPALSLVQLTLESDRPVDAVDLALPGLAVLAIGGVDLLVPERDRNPVERELLVLGIEPHRHRRA